MVVFSTDFIGADGTLLPAFDVLFYAVSGNMQIWSNGATGYASVPGTMDMVGVDAAISPDQYFDFIVDTDLLGGGGGIGGCLRAGAAASGDGYYWLLSPDSGAAYFGALAAGAFTNLYSAPLMVLPGQHCRGEVRGNDFVLTLDGVPWFAGSDSTYAAGMPGLVGYLADHENRASFLEVGDFSSPGGVMMPAFVPGL